MLIIALEVTLIRHCLLMVSKKWLCVPQRAHQKLGPSSAVFPVSESEYKAGYLCLSLLGGPMSIAPRLCTVEREVVSPFPRLARYTSPVEPHDIAPAPGDSLLPNNLVPAPSVVVLDARAFVATNGRPDWRDAPIERLALRLDLKTETFTLEALVRNAEPETAAVTCMLAAPRERVPIAEGVELHVDGVRSVHQVIEKRLAEKLAEAANRSEGHTATVSRGGDDAKYLSLKKCPPGAAATFRATYKDADVRWTPRCSSLPAEQCDIEVLLPTLHLPSCPASDGGVPLTIVVEVPDGVRVELPDTEVAEHDRSARAPSQTVVWMAPLGDGAAQAIFTHGACFDGRVKVRLVRDLPADAEWVADPGATPHESQLLVRTLCACLLPGGETVTVCDVAIPAAPPSSSEVERIVVDLRLDLSASMFMRPAQAASTNRVLAQAALCGMMRALHRAFPAIQAKRIASCASAGSPLRTARSVAATSLSTRTSSGSASPCRRRARPEGRCSDRGWPTSHAKWRLTRHPPSSSSSRTGATT